MGGFVTNLRANAVDAVAAQVANTKHFQRYKGTWLIVLSGLVGMIGGITPYLAGAPVWVVPVVSAVATFAAALVNRLTKDAFTPSMEERIADYVPDVVVQEVPAEAVPRDDSVQPSVESAIASARHAAESTASEVRTQVDSALESARAAYRDATRRE